MNLFTQEGWKAELTYAVGYVPRWLSCQQTITHPSCNPAQCRAIALIETNVLTTARLDFHVKGQGLDLQRLSKGHNLQDPGQERDPHGQVRARPAKH